MSLYLISAVVDGDTLSEMKADCRYFSVKSEELPLSSAPYRLCYKVWDFMVAFGIEHDREDISRAEIIKISESTLTPAQVDRQLHQLVSDGDIQRVRHGRYTGAYYSPETEVEYL